MYATVDEFLVFLRPTELVSQSNWEPTEQFVNREYAQKHLDFASTEIDAALGVRYVVPILPAPPILTQIALSIAWWECERIGEVRQTVQVHYERAIEKLKALASGDMALIGLDGSPVPTIPGGSSDANSAVSSVGQRPLIGFIDWGIPMRRRPLDGERRIY